MRTKSEMGVFSDYPHIYKLHLEGKKDELLYAMRATENGEFIISMPLVTSKSKKLPQYYCFTTGRHVGSFFLKIGAAIFCIGHIIHNLLNNNPKAHYVLTW